MQTSGYLPSAKLQVGTYLFNEQEDLVKIPRTPYHKQGLLSPSPTAHCWAQICSNTGTEKPNPDNICHCLERKKGLKPGGQNF